jgi:hypothetical protein
VVTRPLANQQWKFNSLQEADRRRANNSCSPRNAAGTHTLHSLACAITANGF